MHNPLTTDKQKYYQLMALVCEDLTSTTKAIDQLVRGGHEATAAQLSAVRFGRHINLPWLISLVQISLPHFPIPEELLPAAPVAQAGAAMSLDL